MKELLEHLDRLHTTEQGAIRLRRNLALPDIDPVLWCRRQITAPDATAVRRGKNWYITVGGAVITVNAHSYTIITAHRTPG